MKRREFITLLSGAGVAWPLAALRFDQLRRREFITLVGGAVAWPFVVVRKATVCGAPAKRLVVG